MIPSVWAAGPIYGFHAAPASLRESSSRRLPPGPPLTLSILCAARRASPGEARPASMVAGPLLVQRFADAALSKARWRGSV
jgi:hypothetical protein